MKRGMPRLGFASSWPAADTGGHDTNPFSHQLRARRGKAGGVMETFYALLSPAVPEAARGLTQDEARDLRGELLIDVTELQYTFRPDAGNWYTTLVGPKVPSDGSVFDRYQGIVAGGPTVEESDYQNLLVEGDPTVFPPEQYGAGFVLEYEADNELIYTDHDYYGRPAVWLFLYGGDQYALAFTSYVVGGLGLKSFRIHSGTGSQPSQGFWTGFQKSFER